MKSNMKTFWYTLLGASYLAFPGVSYGQNSARSADSDLGEIIVTARKKSETLLDVPVAVYAIGGDEIQRQGVNDLNRIGQLVPQVILAKADSGTGASFSIRGLGSSFTDPGLEQSVSVVIDGATVSRGNIVRMGMFDIAQVEVMKGPQALFFGKNSPAGVVSLTSAGATDQLEGYIRAGYEFEARERFVEGAISGPISETLKGRLALRGSKLRGWVRNGAVAVEANPNFDPTIPFMPRTPGAQYKWGPGDREIMARGTLTWEPSSDFSSTLKVAFGDSKGNGTTNQGYCGNGGASVPTLGGLQIDPNGDCTFDKYNASTGPDPRLITPGWARMREKPYATLQTWLATNTMDYRTDNLTFTSVTSYMNLDYIQANNFDDTSLGLANAAIYEKTESFAQELRLLSDFDGPLNFTLGAYYEESKRNTGSAALVIFAGPDPITGNYHSFHSDAVVKAKTLSGFGQLRWNITEQIELAGGVRWTKDKRRQSVRNLYRHPIAGPAFRLVPTDQSSNGKSSFTNWSPEFTLSYKPQNNIMMFVAYKTGYKAGGYSSPVIFPVDPRTGMAPDGNNFAFGPEKAKGFEGGIKAKLANNTVRVEATVYRYKYSDLQQSIFIPETFSYSIKNAASAKIQGVELSVEWKPIPELRLFTNGGYNDAKFTAYPTAQCYVGQTPLSGCIGNAQDLSGRTLPRAPKWNISTGAALDLPITNDWMIGISGDIFYTSKYFTQETQDPYSIQKGFTRINAGLRVYSEDDRYEIALIGRNLENKRYVQVSTATTFATQTGQLKAATPRGREVRLQATYRF